MPKVVFFLLFLQNNHFFNELSSSKAKETDVNAFVVLSNVSLTAVSYLVTCSIRSYYWISFSVTQDCTIYISCVQRSSAYPALAI